MNKDFQKALETEVLYADSRFNNLMNDFLYAVDMNRIAAERLYDMQMSLPTEEELKLMIDYLENSTFYNENLKLKRERIMRLTLLLSKVKALARFDSQFTVPEAPKEMRKLYNDFESPTAIGDFVKEKNGQN